ncbi:MAG: OB-fold domain-containing protein, partial [bacterium]|nr:OB-fold domain-containing protein [bacterium]
MIASLSGKIILKREKFIILDVGGVGFKVFLSRKALLKIPQEGESLKVFCYLNVRENILDLYGFLDFEELELF